VKFVLLGQYWNLLYYCSKYLQITLTPPGNFYFLDVLKMILKHLHEPRSDFMICNDLTVNFLIDTTFKPQVSLLFQSYNMFHVVDFPTRIKI